MKANMPVMIVSSQKTPAALALKSGEDSVIWEANGASMVFPFGDLHGTSVAPHSDCDRQENDAKGQSDPDTGGGEVSAQGKLAQGIQTRMLWIGEIEGRRGGRTKAILDKRVEVIGAESNSLEEYDGDPGKDSPEKGSAAGPAGDQQHPAIGGDVPDGQDNNPVEKKHDVQEVVGVRQRGGRTHPMDQQDNAG